MTVQVLICTYEAGIERVPLCLLPPIEGVSWLVAYQYTHEAYQQNIPETLAHRTDVQVIPVYGKGLSANRNHALLHATGDLLVLADDDVRFQPEYFQAITQTFQENPHLDIGCFKADTYDGQPYNVYPDFSFSYAQTPRGYSYHSMGIVIRKTAHWPLFDTNLGIGADYLGCGEEEVFLHRAYLQGLHIQYYPTVVIQTRGASTADSFFADPRLQRAKGAVLYAMHGRLGATLRCLKYAFVQGRAHRPLALFAEMRHGIRYYQQRLQEQPCLQETKQTVCESVSFVIPFYNRAAYLPRTLQSLLNMVVLPKEVILVDNLSNDNSVWVASQYIQPLQERGVKVQLITCEQRGAACARNQGLSVCQTPYIYFFDSDDEFSPDFLTHIQAKLSLSTPDMLVCATNIVFPNAQTHKKYYGFTAKADFQILTSFLATQCVVARTAWLQKQVRWNEQLTFWDDYEWGVRLLLAQPTICFLPSSRAYHWIHAHAESLTGNDFASHQQQIRQVLDAIREAINNAPKVEDSARLMYALQCRTAIIAGHLHREDAQAAATQLLQLISVKKHGISLPWKVRFLYLYTKWGGRGAWKLAQ